MSAVKGKAQKQKSKSKSTKQEMGSCNQKEAILSSPTASIDNEGKTITEPLINQKQTNTNDKPKSKSMLSSFKKKVSKAMKSMTPTPVDESSGPKFTKMAECITESTIDDMRKRLSALEVELETSSDHAHKADLIQIIQALELDIRAAELEEYADALDKKQADTDIKTIKSAMVVLEARARTNKPFYLIGKDIKAGDLYTFPVGKIEKGESTLDAAKREFLEEIGCELSGIITELGMEEWTDPSNNVLHQTTIFHSYEPEKCVLAGELVDVKFYSLDAIKLMSEEGKGRKCLDFIFSDNISKKLKLLSGGAKLALSVAQSNAMFTPEMIQSVAKNVSAPWGDDAVTKAEPNDDELVNESRADRLWWFKRAISNDSKVNTPDEIMSKVWKYSNHADRQDVINFIISKGYTCTSKEDYEKIADVTTNVMKIVTDSKDSLLEEMMLQSDKIVAKVEALQSALSDIKLEQPYEEKFVESVDLGINEDSEDVSDEGSIEDDKALFLTQCLKLIESEDTVMANMWKVFIEYASTSEAGVQAKLLEDGSANKPDLIAKYNDSPVHSLKEESASSGGGGKSFSEKKAMFETQSPELIKEDEKRRKMNAIMKDFHILHGENFEYNAHLDHLTVGDRKVHIRICPDDNQPFVFTAKNKPSNRCDIFEVLESKMYAQCEFQAKNTSDIPMLKALADRFTEYMQSYTDLQNCDGSASV